jgi:pimeloyl-ACP methyl ester carboxylesterase/DNA-binding SARP family transcriptional activator
MECGHARSLHHARPATVPPTVPPPPFIVATVIEVRVLGGLAALVDGEPVELPADARARELLAWLAVHPGRHPRAALAGRLRPDVLDESARKSLRDAIYELRRTLGPEAIDATRDAVGLGPAVEVDLARVRDAAAAGELAAAVEGGPLLDGLDADWAIAARAGHAAEVAQRLAALAAADPAGAITWARRRVDVEPLSEAAHRDLMRILAGRGDRAAALATYAALAARLRRELGLAPAAETRALAEELRRGGGAPARREQAIRFATAGGLRVAYAVAGAGPPLVLPAMWISHLEAEWEFPEVRAFVEALAAEHTVIRYDRLGTGLSDREARPGMEAELATLAAVIAAAGAVEPALLGVSRGGPTAVAYAAARAVRRIALVGAYAYGAAIAPPALREALAGTVRAHWGAGSRVLADIWMPGADGALRDRFAAYQRASASPDVAATLLAEVYAVDVRPLLGSVHVPALVVHRRDDRAMPFAGARELAAGLPDAELVALPGDVHPPWLGDPVPVLDAVLGFLRG